MQTQTKLKVPAGYQADPKQVALHQALDHYAVNHKCSMAAAIAQLDPLKRHLRPA